MFVVAIICWVIALIALGIGFIVRSGWTIAGGAASALLGFMFLIFSTYYTIEPGEAKVLKNWTGEVVGSESAPGAHWKDPWVDAVDFDVRNQTAVFIGDGSQQYGGEPTTGPQITFTDKDGVTANMDLVILYSIDPNVVERLVEDYSSQQAFTTKVIEQDARSVPRDVPGRYTTIEMLTNRAQVTADIRKLLEDEWESKGIAIEDVSLQEIRYPDSVRQRFEDAQNAQTEVVKAEADLRKAEIDAQQKVVQAQAESDANKILAASLTPEILQQRYLDVLADANLIVVPQNFTALGNLPQLGGQ